MSLRNFVCRRHMWTSNRTIRQLNTPTINPSSSSSLPLLGIQFSLRKRYYILLTEEVEESLLIRSWEEETTPTTVYLTHSVYMSDDRFYQEISKLIIRNWNTVEFQDRRNSIIENTMREVRHIIKHDSNKGRQKLDVCVDLKLVNVCMGRMLVPEEEIALSNRMVPASKSSMKLLKKMEIDEERYSSKDECCVVCLDELIVKESDDAEILCMPCSHMFHGECITKWLETSHYCPICRFQMPTEQD
uniref:RING-type E3 ubiquitin transferase n=1 Tax=Nicotiana sylvestris TaxID=4096 RepID=A0A1U7XM18_NICSY|nr:PREDICTED: putative RING-H2 finger protein ATL36 [Nicotiana sylvestris]